jgi:GNAT superfamily N-acetyltransferase
VARSEEDAAFLIGDIDESLEWWRENPDSSLHLKYGEAGVIAGVLLIKEFWNLTNLFVAPDYQRQGIGRLLLNEALQRCRSRSPRAAVLVNSSTYAAGFYERMHFVQTGPGKDRPGGCVPFRYDF